MSEFKLKDIMKNMIVEASKKPQIGSLKLIDQYVKENKKRYTEIMNSLKSGMLNDETIEFCESTLDAIDQWNAKIKEHLRAKKANLDKYNVEKQNEIKKKGVNLSTNDDVIKDNKNPLDEDMSKGLIKKIIENLPNDFSNKVIKAKELIPDSDNAIIHVILTTLKKDVALSSNNIGSILQAIYDSYPELEE